METSFFCDPTYLNSLVHKRTCIWDEVVVQGRVVLRDLDQFFIVVIPDCSPWAKDHFHHRTESAEFQPASEEFLVLDRWRKISSCIGTPHRKIDKTGSQSSFDRHLQSVKIGPTVTVPKCGVFSSRIVNVARENEVVVTVDIAQALRRKLGKENA